MKYARKVISLLLAMVMALSLTTGVWAENGGGTGKTLAETLNITNTDAANYVNQYFAYEHFDDGDFLVINGADTNGGFYQCQSDKAKATTAINACTNEIYNVLKDVEVQDGQYTTTFKDRFNLFKEMLGAPLLRPEGGTGNITNIGNADRTYVNDADVSLIKTYLTTHFNIHVADDGNCKVNLLATSINSDGTFNDASKAQAAVEAYYNGDLRPRHYVALNQLQINVSDAFGQQNVYFWQLIDKYQGMLKNNGGGNQSGGGNNQAPTGDKSPSELTNNEAKNYLESYVAYETNPYVQGVVSVTFKGTSFSNGLYANETARKAAIDAYNAYLRLNSDAKDALNTLFVTDDKGEPCWFSDRVEALFVLAKNQTSGTPAGSISDADAKLNDDFRKAGYKAPTLGVNFHLEFPDALALGTDYDYTYNSSTGHLIITVKAPTEDARERWLQAGADSFAPDSVLANFYFSNVARKTGYSMWSGDGNVGWQTYLDEEMVLEYEENALAPTVGNGHKMATKNKADDVLSVTSAGNSGMNRIVLVWGNKGDNFPQMDKYMLTYEVRTESPFYYEQENVTTLGKVDPNRVTLTYDSNVPVNCFVQQKNENGILKLLQEESYGKNLPIGRFTVAPPVTGYQLERWQELNSDSYGDGTSIPLNNGESSFYQFVWSNGQDNIEEELTVYVAEMGISNLGSYGSNGETLTNPLPVTTPNASEVNLPTSTSMTVSYDAASGFVYTSFDNANGLPTYQQLNAGILMEPTGFEGATHFRVNNRSGNDKPGMTDVDVKNAVIGMYKLGDEFTYALNDANNDELRTFYFVDTEYKNVGGVNVSYAGSQAYRFKIVQWLKQEANGEYTVLGYSYVSGRNEAFVSKTVTESVPTPTESNAPFVVGKDMRFCCERYPQMDGNKEMQYFRFYVRGEGSFGKTSYTVYIPYSYFGDLTWEQAQRRTSKPVIHHYNDSHQETETLTGEYTPYGIRFTVSHFSPFVVDCSVASNSGSGSTGGGGYRVNTAVKADSPATFDAGIALYGALAISSLTGMAYVGKKKF